MSSIKLILPKYILFTICCLLFNFTLVAAENSVEFSLNLKDFKTLSEPPLANKFSGQDVPKRSRSVAKYLSLPLPGFDSGSAAAPLGHLQVKEKSEQILKVPIYYGREDASKASDGVDYGKQRGPQVRNTVEVLTQRLADSEKKIEGAIARAGGQVRGTFYSRNEDTSELLWSLEPSEPVSAEHDILSATHRVTSYKLSELVRDSRCPTLKKEFLSFDPFVSGNQRLSLSLQTDSWRKIGLVLVAPTEFAGGKSDEEITLDLVSAVQAANIYLRSLRLQLELKGIEIFHHIESDPYSRAGLDENAFEMLDEVQRQWRSRLLPEHDLVGVVGRGSFGSVYGLAFAATSCVSPGFSFLFAAQGGGLSSGPFSLGAALAHEVGHFVGMDHDEVLYNGAPSLMWPFFVQNPFGFSPFSIDQYEEYAGVGAPGGSCFAELLSPPQDSGGEVGINDVGATPLLAFNGRQQLDILEGIPFRWSASGGENPLPGVTYSALGLPEWASLNPQSGVFEFKPGFDVLRGNLRDQLFSITVFARSQFRDEQGVLTLRVVNNNRAPRFVSPLSTVAQLEGGQEWRETFSVVDDDSDPFSLVFSSLQSFLRLPGERHFDLRAYGATLVWVPPDNLNGEFQVSFSATDIHGAKTVKQITLRVKQRNLPPELSVIGDPGVNKDGDWEAQIGFRDPEGKNMTVDISGLPAGSLVSKDLGQAHIKIGAQALIDVAKDGQSFTVKVSDGEKQTQLELPIAGVNAQNVPTDSTLWPGAGAVSSLVNRDKPLFSYHPASGKWNVRFCDGSLSQLSQFGGFIGDIPVTRTDNGLLEAKTYRGVYRIVAGQGYWVFEDAPLVNIPWGLARDIPLTADFDGDGNSELLVFRPDTGNWFLRYHDGHHEELQGSGFSEEKSIFRYPFAKDVDGDGRAERIVFSELRNGGLVFDVWFADERQLRFYLGERQGGGSVRPYVQDFDRDGRVDFGVISAGGKMRIFSSRKGKIIVFDTAYGEGDQIAFRECGKTAQMLVFAEDYLDSEIYHFFGNARTREKRAIAISKEVFTLDELYFRRVLGTERPARRDLDADGITDYSVYRAAQNQKGGFWLSRTSGGHIFSLEPTGRNYVYPLSMNINGGAQSLLGVFSDGQWLFQDASGIEESLSWGESGDVPVPADYDGDGILDVAVFRPSNGSWWIIFSSGGANTYNWGGRGDVPVPGDYNGDGVSDLAVWRPVTGAWMIFSINGGGGGWTKVQILGDFLDTPVVGDYDGDGVSDFAVWRRDSGQWFIKTSSGFIISKQWGLPGDIPLNGDFDGDGRDDLVVWRPSDGTWYSHRVDSLSEFPKAVQFGLPSDLPAGGGNRLLIQ